MWSSFPKFQPLLQKGDIWLQRKRFTKPEEGGSTAKIDRYNFFKVLAFLKLILGMIWAWFMIYVCCVWQHLWVDPEEWCNFFRCATYVQGPQWVYQLVGAGFCQNGNVYMAPQPMGWIPLPFSLNLCPPTVFCGMRKIAGARGSGIHPLGSTAEESGGSGNKLMSKKSSLCMSHS